tara:strand:+ start:408 stop:920 length:513 start_codon:yes stop_codon:yes gene_type:complete
MAVTINGNTGVVTGLAALPDSAMASGSIIQVQQTLWKSHTSFTTASSMTDVGLSCTITPSSTSSNILCHFGLRLCTASAARYAIALVRGSTTLDIGDTGNSVSDRGLVDGTMDGDRGAAYPNSFYLDTGISTTSATTYKLQIQVSSNFTINFRSGSSSGCSFMTLMEVAG